MDYITMFDELTLTEENMLNLIVLLFEEFCKDFNVKLGNECKNLS